MENKIYKPIKKIVGHGEQKAIVVPSSLRESPQSMTIAKLRSILPKENIERRYKK